MPRFRQIQAAIYEYSCSSCGKTLQDESTPNHWTTYTAETYAAMSGRVVKSGYLCAECVHLPEYKWMRDDG